MKTKKKYNTNKKNKNYSRKIVGGGIFSDGIQNVDYGKNYVVSKTGLGVKATGKAIGSLLTVVIPGLSLFVKNKKRKDYLQSLNDTKTRLRSFVKIEVLNSLKKIIKKDEKYYTGEELGKIIFFMTKYNIFEKMADLVIEIGSYADSKNADIFPIQKIWHTIDFTGFDLSTIKGLGSNFTAQYSYIQPNKIYFTCDQINDENAKYYVAIGYNNETDKINSDPDNYEIHKLENKKLEEVNSEMIKSSNKTKLYQHNDHQDDSYRRIHGKNPVKKTSEIDSNIILLNFIKKLFKALGDYSIGEYDIDEFKENFELLLSFLDSYSINVKEVYNMIENAKTTKQQFEITLNDLITAGDTYNETKTKKEDINIKELQATMNSAKSEMDTKKEEMDNLEAEKEKLETDLKTLESDKIRKENIADEMRKEMHEKNDDNTKTREQKTNDELNAAIREVNGITGQLTEKIKQLTLKKKEFEKAKEKNEKAIKNYDDGNKKKEMAEKDLNEATRVKEEALKKFTEAYYTAYINAATYQDLENMNENVQVLLTAPTPPSTAPTSPSTPPTPPVLKHEDREALIRKWNEELLRVQKEELERAAARKVVDENLKQKIKSNIEKIPSVEPITKLEITLLKINALLSTLSNLLDEKDFLDTKAMIIEKIFKNNKDYFKKYFDDAYILKSIPIFLEFFMNMDNENYLKGLGELRAYINKVYKQGPPRSLKEYIELRITDFKENNVYLQDYSGKEYNMSFEEEDTLAAKERARLGRGRPVPLNFQSTQLGGGIFGPKKITGPSGVIADKETNSIKKMFKKKRVVYDDSDKDIFLKFIFHSTYEFYKVFTEKLAINDDEIRKFFNNYIDRLMKLIRNNLSSIVNGSTIYSEIAQVLCSLFSAKLKDSIDTAEEEEKTETSPSELVDNPNQQDMDNILSEINERKLLGSSFFFNYKNKSILNFIFKVYENINNLDIKLDTVRKKIRIQKLVRVLDERFNKEILGISVNYKDYDSYKKNEEFMEIINDIFGPFNIFAPKTQFLSNLDKEIDSAKTINALTKVIEDFFKKNKSIFELSVSDKNVCFNLKESVKNELTNLSNNSRTDEDKDELIRELRAKVGELESKLSERTTQSASVPAETVVSTETLDSDKPLAFPTGVYVASPTGDSPSTASTGT